MKRSVEMFFPAKKAILCILAALLLTAFAYAVAPSKAHAAQTINTVYVNYDTSKVKLDASLTGNEANDLFKENRSLGEQTKEMCKLDYMYSFLAEDCGRGSTGQILRKRQVGNEGLLSADKGYFLVFNLIQREGYEFPHNDATKDAKLPMTVYVNGQLVSGTQVDRYNTDSVDVYVPIKCSNNVVVKSITIDPSEIYMKKGGEPRPLKATVKGTQGIPLEWTLTGNASEGTNVDSAGNVTVASDEPKGRTLIVKAKSVDVPSVYGTCIVHVDDRDLYIDRVIVTGPDPKMGQNANVDVRGGAKTLAFKVDMVGTADHDYELDLQCEQAKGTKITKQTRDGFELTVDSYEPTGVLRIVLTSKVDSKTSLTTVNVTGVDRIFRIDLNIDTSKLYNDNSGTQTVQSIYDYLSSSYVKSARSDTFVDFSKRTDPNELLYTYLVKRKGSGWNEGSFERVRPGTGVNLVKGTQYYLKLNIDNYERRQTGNSLWPDDLSKISIAVNGVLLGNASTTGDWYSKGATGSIIVYVLLGQKSDVKYVSSQFAPGFHLITLSGVSAPWKSGMAGVYKDIYTYKDQKMIYDFDKGVWHFFSEGEKPSLVFTDFKKIDTPVTQMSSFYAYEVKGLESYDYEAVGDVNGNGKLNVVDAQIIYDVACGVYKKTSDLDTYTYKSFATGLVGTKALFFCDVNGDHRVDASDARAVQLAALNGSSL